MPRALVAGALLSIFLLQGGLQISRQAPVCSVEHVLANRPPVTPTLTFEGPDFALIVAGGAPAALAFSGRLVLRAAPILEPRLAQFSHYIRPPPSA